MEPRTGGTPNHLINEKSPYLLQHAYNPVDWYPWNESSLFKARNENKPIFLSIGYSTCHWCHVMERESFENEEIASILNRVCVCIKVDREERPDIDGIYMYACELINGSGGWPLTIIMTPEKEPFFAATYMPAYSRHTFLGLSEVLPQIETLWLTQQNSVRLSAEKFTDALQNFFVHPASNLPDLTIRDSAYDKLQQEFDSEYGGFGPAPKFPNPQIYSFLLRYYKRTQKPDALRMVTKSLTSMRLGGIYDQIGYGFHRYSTDEYWRIPHYEKMLYDQAMLIIAYTEAFQVTGDQLYADTAREIIEYSVTTLRDPAGGFYCAEDADVNGEEGSYYLWSDKEVRDTLTEGEYTIASRLYSINSHGNVGAKVEFLYEHQNILYRKNDLNAVFEGTGIEKEQWSEVLNSIRNKLFNKRQMRIKPGIDDKVITDWNGLMIASLSLAARAFSSPQFKQYAIDAADFILKKLISEDGRLLHRYRDNQSAIHGFCDDYAFLSWGLLELYLTTFEVRYLKESIRLMHILREEFTDKAAGGLFDSSEKSEQLLFRRKEAHDAPYPSGNAIAALVSFKLSLLLADPAFFEHGTSIVKAFAGDIIKMPHYFSTFLNCTNYWTNHSSLVIIAGDTTDESTVALLNAVKSAFLPSTVVVLRPTETSDPSVLSIMPALVNYTILNGAAAAYVCTNGICHDPVTDVDEMMALLRQNE